MYYSKYITYKTSFAAYEGKSSLGVVVAGFLSVHLCCPKLYI